MKAFGKQSVAAVGVKKCSSVTVSLEDIVCVIPDWSKIISFWKN